MHKANFKFNPMYLAIIFTCLFLTPFVWWDSVDPAFIPKDHYKILEKVIFPVICVIASFLLLSYMFKRYQTDNAYKQNLDLNILNKSKLERIISLLLLPFVFYMFSWLIFAPATQLYGHYFSNVDWAEKFEVIKVSSCGKVSNYGDNCSRLKIKSIRSNKIYSFRWYEDKKLIYKLKNKTINLTGSENYFGNYVDNLEW